LLSYKKYRCRILRLKGVLKKGSLYPLIIKTFFVFLQYKNNLVQYDVDAQPTPLEESLHRSLWSLQITITLTETALLIFLQFVLEKLLAWASGD